MMSLILTAAALASQALPPPFPRDGATRVFENDQVVIWDVSWKKGVATPLHEHRYSALSVTIQPGQVKSHMPDGSSRTGDIEEVGNVQYGGKGLIHREEGVSERPRRVFLLELREKPSPADAMPDHVAPAWPREGATQILDNDLVVVWDYEFRAGRAASLHYHDKDQVVVALSPGRIRWVPAKGEAVEKKIAAGSAEFVPRGSLHREEHLSGAPRVVVIELKR